MFQRQLIKQVLNSFPQGFQGGENLIFKDAIGRSQGGLSTKIHAVVDALGNPVSFHLTPGQASDLEGADPLLPHVVADTVLGDKGYDADARVLEQLQAQGKTAVMPPRSNWKEQREYDKE